VLSWIFAVLLAAAAGALIGSTALRTRGISLGIATLGLGSALYDIVLTGPYSGGDTGIQVSDISLFGWSIDPFSYPGRYSLVGLVVLLLVIYAAINIRRGVVGRHLIAVRSNERAAAALGIRVPQVKLFAFVVASGMAAAGACVLSFLSQSVVTSSFDVLSSINFITVTVVGGLGSIGGALIGSTLITGGVTSQLVQGLGIDNWLALFGGVSVLVIIVQNQDGVLALNRRQARLIAQRLPRWARLPDRVARAVGSRRAGLGHRRAPGQAVPVADRHSELVPPRVLSVTGLTVRFGNVTAVDNVALRLEPGRWRRYAADIMLPRRATLTPTALAAVQRFGLEPDLDAKVDVLSFGRRRLVAIARAVAGGPSLLLLDEPASGLDAQETNELGGFIRMLADQWGLAILLVEHNVELVLSICDEVTVLASGANLVHGPPAEIRSDPRVLDAYLGSHGQSDVAGDVPSQINGQR
jgi:sulfate-transporting ATPase